MKLKKEYIILAVIIIAISVYLYKRSTDRTFYELPEIPQVNQKDVTKLEITKGASSIVLNKKDDKWYIEPADYPADPGKIKNMLNALENFSLTALVSESKNYNLYELDPEQKINVKAWQGDNLRLDFDLGKTASSFRHTFVRPSGEERVFHAQGNLKNSFDVNVDQLRDMSVLALNPADIQQVQITKEQQSLAFTRTAVPVEVKTPETEKKEASSPPPKQLVWQAANGQPVNETALNQLLNSVSNLRCEKFLDDRKKEDYTSPLFTLRLKGAEEYSLAIYPKAEDKETGYPAVSSGSDYPFQLAGSQVDRIMQAPSAFLQKSEADQKKSEPQKPESTQ
ncbi:MAG: DUF4340 domain-containing protein [Desulfobacterales bacterium]|nr:MAG: DUF4340 domain-containing protein [Desulfobacterales bacterium]